MSTKTSPKSVYGALYLELQEKGIPGRTKPSVFSTVSIDMDGDFMLLSSSGYTVGVPEACLEEIKQTLGRHYRIFKIEFTPGTEKAKHSCDFEQQFAVDLAATLKPNQLEAFLTGETRTDLLELRVSLDTLAQ
jgi:hypothetical protein